ncbi:histidine phosphatase family protein [Pseudomonas chlororaphis]|uniref:Histidine phosphatase family protein n=1 Tax=Pseudomonas chlororaphis TaxID=587753 RepID=A0A1Q8EVF6_9PSED|nr:histidine phosphatase family protein [Pseudomonas chlororaphis]
MASGLSLPVAKPALGARRLARYRNTLVIALVALLVLPLTLFLLKPAAVPDLAHGNVPGATALSAGWAKGQMIVLIRHVERCDHSRAACLNAPDGITDRARDVAVGVGARFEHLGLAKADIYHSPLTRAVQTAGYMFSQAGSGEDWLINCRQHLLRDALAHKVAGRNLVLVTHSECMNALEKELKLPSSTLGYGASLFVSTDTLDGRPKMLGFIEASDWRSVALNRP